MPSGSRRIAVPFKRNKRAGKRNRRKGKFARRRSSMKVRVLFLAVVCTIAALVATVAQTNINQGASQPPVDESKPAAVAIPAPENEPTGEGRPLAPPVPGESSRTQVEQSMQLQS